MAALSGFNLGNSARLLGVGIDIGKGKGRPTSDVQSGMIFGRGKFIPIEEGKETYIGRRADLYRLSVQPI